MAYQSWTEQGYKLCISDNVWSMAKADRGENFI